MGWISVLFAVSVLQAAPQPTVPRDEAPRVLVVTYSDGRIAEQILRARGGFWTHLFPRQPNPSKYGDLDLAALQIDFTADTVVNVKVSLKYGTPHQKTIQVATANVGTEAVRITDLERYGVDPIVLTIETAPPVALVRPTVASASPLLDVSVELTRNDIPVYAFTIRNRSSRAVMAAQYVMFRNGAKVGTGRRKTNEGNPMIDPGDEDRWTSHLSSGKNSGFDHFEVTSVLWDDGSVEGDPELKQSEDALSIGHAQQLRQVLVILKDAVARGNSTEDPMTVTQLRAAFEGLLITIDLTDPAARPAVLAHGHSIQIGRQQIKDAVLRDLDAFAAKPAAQSFVQVWVAEARARYSGWLSRTQRR
jgi:hypothetical protein